MASFIPESAWESMGKEVIRQICNIAYFDNDKSPDERYPKREILNIITAFLEKNINLQEADLDEKCKLDFFKSMAENMRTPIAKLYENDMMAIRFMEGILHEYPHIFMNIMNMVAEQTEKQIETDKSATFIDVFMQKITNYIKVENEISQTTNTTAVNEATAPTAKGETTIQEIETIPNLQEIIIENIRKYGALQNSDNTEKFKKLTNEELIQHVDKLIEAIVKTNADNTTRPENSPLSTVSSMIPDMNPLKILAQETVGNMPKEFVDKVFETLETSDEKPYSEIKTEIYSTILSSLQYHLERPEGRQMYLRHLEPIIRHYTVQSLMNDDTTVICIFQMIRDSPKINSIIRKCAEEAYATKNHNFKTPSFSTTSPATHDMGKIIIAYQPTFAYHMYQSIDSEIKELIENNNPIAQIYKDLEQFKVPELVSIRKHTIDYAKTMCSPGMLQSEIKTDRKTIGKNVDVSNQRSDDNVYHDNLFRNSNKTVAETNPITQNTITGEKNFYKTMDNVPTTLQKNRLDKDLENKLNKTMDNVPAALQKNRLDKDLENKLYKTMDNTTAALQKNVSGQDVKNKLYDTFSAINPVSENTTKTGGNIHKTYRKMTQKRHKYTRKT